jgi:hypothetical protein
VRGDDQVMRGTRSARPPHVREQGADLCLMAAITVAAIVTGKYAMLVTVCIGLALLPLAARTWRSDRQRVQRAHELNA